MLNTTHIHGFRKPKYAGEQSEYVNCQQCAGEMWQELEKDLEILLETPGYVEKVLNNKRFAFYYQDQYKYQTNRIYEYTFILSSYEKIIIAAGNMNKYEKAMYIFNQHGKFNNYEEDYALEYEYDVIKEIFEIGTNWLGGQPFTTFAEFQKFYRDLQIMKTQELEMCNSPR